MPYSYNGAAINFPPEGEYISFSSVSSVGAIVPGTQTLVLGTSVNDLPSFPANQDGTIPQLSADDYFPIVNVNAGTSFAYKVTLGQINNYITTAMGVSGVGGNLILGGGLLLDEDQFIKWEYDIIGNPVPQTFGIAFHRTSGFKFRDFEGQHNIFKVDPDGVLVLAALETTLGGQPSVATAGGLHYYDGNLYFGK